MTARTMLFGATPYNNYVGPAGSFLGSAGGFSAGALIQPVGLGSSTPNPVAILGTFDGTDGWLLAYLYDGEGVFNIVAILGDSGGPTTVTSPDLHGVAGQLMWCGLTVGAGGTDVLLTVNGNVLIDASGVLTGFVPAPAGESMRLGSGPAPYADAIESRFGEVYYHDSTDLSKSDLMYAYVTSQEYGRPMRTGLSQMQPGAGSPDPVLFDYSWSTADLLDGGPQIFSGLRGVNTPWTPFSGDVELTLPGADAGEVASIITIPEGKEQWYSPDAAFTPN